MQGGSVEPAGSIVFDLVPPRPWERLRFIVGWSCFAVGTAAMTFVLGRPLLPGQAPWPAWQIAYLVLLGIGTAGVGAWRSRPGRPRPDVSFGSEALVVPRSRFSRRSRALRYEDIESFSIGWPDWRRRFWLAARGSLHTPLSAHWFVRPDALERIEEQTRSRIAPLPGAAERLALYDRRAATALGLSRTRPRLTLGLLAWITAIVWLQWRAGAFDDSLEIIREGATHWWLLRDGGWYRVFVAGFLHVAWWHYATNALALAFVGPILEGILGGWRFTIVLLGGMLGGALTTSQTGSSPTVGFSLGIYALLGAVFVLNIVRRRELPPPLHVTIWLAIPMLLNELMLATAFPTLDRVGHWSSFAFGVALCLAVLRGHALADLRRPPVGWVRVAAGLLAALYVAGLGRGAHFVATADASTIRRIVLDSVEDPGLGYEIVLLIGREVAMAEDSTRDELETARRATQAVVHRHRGDLLSQSLLATLEYRLGHLDRAAARQRQVDDLLPAPGHCSLLARFEHARRVERRAADPSADERSPRIRVARRDGSDAIVAVELEVDGAAPSDLATDVLVESEGRPLGLIRIRPGPLEPGEPVVFELPSDRPRPRADASLSLAHAGRLRGPETRWESAARYCPIVPDVVALPGRRPPVSSRP